MKKHALNLNSLKSFKAKMVKIFYALILVAILKNGKSNKRSFETINNLDHIDLWLHKQPQRNGLHAVM